MSEAVPSLPETSPAAAPDTAGGQLRRAREAAGLSLADVSARTKIRESHLAMIEAGDYAGLPARTYAVGFSRSYARALGLDGEAVVAAVRAELNAAQPQPERLSPTFEPGDPARVPGSAVTWIAALAAVAVLIAGLVFWRSYYSPAEALPPVTAPAPSPSAASAPASPGVPVSGPVVFTALEPGVWVKFYDGAGQQIMQKQMAAGETFTVPADATDPKVWTARPDALAITIGGKPVPKLADEQKTMKDVPVSAAALLARGTPPAADPAATNAPPTGAASGGPVAAAQTRPAVAHRVAHRTAAPRIVAPAPVAEPAAQALPPAQLAPSTVSE